MREHFIRNLYDRQIHLGVVEVGPYRSGYSASR
jgi:hypothetical protein